MKQKINAIITLLMPICLMSSGFVNMILFYFDLQAFDDMRRLISIIILSVFFGLSLIKLIFLCQDNLGERKKIIALCGIPTLWILVFIVAMLQFGIQHTIVFTLGTFGIYCIPAFIFAISIAIERTEETFIKCFKWYALIIAPLMLYYIIRLFITPSFVEKLNNLGTLDYLVLGYTLVPILIFCIIDLFLYKGKNNYLNIVLIIILWVAIVFTGAKGPLVCMLVFLFFFTVYVLVQKQKDKTIFWLFTIMAFILLFLLLVYSPPSAGLYRMNIFINDLKNKNIQSAQMQEKDKELISNLAENASPTKDIQKVLTETPENPQAEGNQTPSLAMVNWDRMFQYKMAIKEGNNAPFTGLGPMGYTLKYGLYPHNIILELIADFGYLIAILFVLIVLILVIFLYRKGKSDKIVACMLLYIISLVPGEMLSSTVYSSVGLLFALGYACAILKLTSKKKLDC